MGHLVLASVSLTDDTVFASADTLYINIYLHPYPCSVSGTEQATCTSLVSEQSTCTVRGSYSLHEVTKCTAVSGEVLSDSSPDVSLLHN